VRQRQRSVVGIVKDTVVRNLHVKVGAKSLPCEDPRQLNKCCRLERTMLPAGGDQSRLALQRHPTSWPWWQCWITRRVSTYVSNCRSHMLSNTNCSLIGSAQGSTRTASMSHIPGANWPSGGSSNPSFRVHLVCNRLFAVCLLFCPFFYLHKRLFLPLDI
jgi:hypothetical protein